MFADKHKPVKSSKKEIYGSRSVAHANGNGDKLSESFRSVFELALESQGSERTAQLLEKLAHELRSEPRPAGGLTTPYVNTIPADMQPDYPGDRVIERRIGHVCAGVHGRPARRCAPAKFPAGVGRGRRFVLVSASLFDAGILAVP